MNKNICLILTVCILKTSLVLVRNAYTYTAIKIMQIYKTQMSILQYAFTFQDGK